MKRNKKYEGQELAGEENKGWGRKRRERRGRLVSQMAGLFVWAARRGEGLFHLSENSSGPQPPQYIGTPREPARSLYSCTSVNLSGHRLQLPLFATFKHLGSQS